METQDKYNAPFPVRLRKLLEDRKITITALAKELKITRQAVSQYADGSIQPNIERLVLIAKFFDVSADYLVGLSEYEKKDTAGLTAESMGILDEAAQQLAEDKQQRAGISGSFLSVLVKSPMFGDFSSAVSEYFRAVAHARSWSNSVSGVFNERKNVRMKQFLLNEALFDVLNDVSPLPDFSEREKKARESGGGASCRRSERKRISPGGTTTKSPFPVAARKPGFTLDGIPRRAGAKKP